MNKWFVLAKRGKKDSLNLIYLDRRGAHSEDATGTLVHYMTAGRVRKYKFYVGSDKIFGNLGVDKYLVLKSNGQNLSLIEERNDLMIGSPPPKSRICMKKGLTEYTLVEISGRKASEIKETRNLMYLLKMQALHNAEKERNYWKERTVKR